MCDLLMVGSMCHHAGVHRTMHADCGARHLRPRGTSPPATSAPPATPARDRTRQPGYRLSSSAGTRRGHSRRLHGGARCWPNAAPGKVHGIDCTGGAPAQRFALPKHPGSPAGNSGSPLPGAQGQCEAPLPRLMLVAHQDAHDPAPPICNPPGYASLLSRGMIRRMKNESDARYCVVPIPETCKVCDDIMAYGAPPGGTGRQDDCASHRTVLGRQ